MSTSASVTRDLQDLLKAVVGKDPSQSYWKANKIAACRDSVGTQEHIKGLLTYVEEISLKPRGSYSEFIVLSHHEDNNLNKQNCISVIMELAHMSGNAACLEQILQDNKHFPGSGNVMINLGVLFSDKVLYDKAEACFKIAKSWFEQEQQHLHTAIANLNLAILYKVLGQIQLARQFCNQTVDLICGHHLEQEICVDLIRLLRTSVFTIRELELQNERAQEVLTKTICLLPKFSHEGTSSVHLTRWLMAMLLKESNGVKVPKEEVVKFFEALYAPLAQSDGDCFVDASFLKAICTLSSMLGDPNEAYTLLKKVEVIFLQTFGPKHCLVGLLLNQVGAVYLGNGKMEDAEIALTQAEEILIASFGRNHPTVASCQLSLGTCIINKGNRSHAFVLLNQAMTVFNKINPKHPQVAEILLKLAELYAEDGKKMAAQETVKQALNILESVCGKVCFKTAGGYFQAAAILKMAGACPTSAINAVEKAVDILSSLGVEANHYDLQMCNVLLGVLQLSMGERKGAKETFAKVPFCDLPDTSTSVLKPEDIITPFNLKSGGGPHLHFIACIISVVNLVYLSTGDELNKHFGMLTNLLKECRMETPMLLDFGGQALFFVSYAMSFSWENAVLIMTSGPVQNASLSGESFDSQCNPKNFMYVSSNVKENNKPFVLFLVSGCLQDIKAAKCVALAFKESVDMLFMQPKFRKIFAEGRILSMELALPDVSPLCMLIDSFPVLVEQKLLELFDKDGTGQSLVLDDPVSCIIQSPVHLSYHSFKCCDNHKADLAFGNMLSQLPTHLNVAVQQVSFSKNTAFFLLHEPENSMVSVVRKKEWIMVKGRFPPGVQFTSSISNSLDEALELVMDSVNDLIEEKSSSLCCEETFTRCLLIDEEFSSIYGSVEAESGSLCSLPSVSVVSHSACEKNLNCESAEVGWHDANFSKEKCQQGISDLVCGESKHHSEIKICLSLLEVLLHQRNNAVVESTSDLEPDVTGCASNEDVNSSLLLPGSAASLNSYGSLNYPNDYLAQHEGTEENSTEQGTLLSDTSDPRLQNRKQAMKVICNSSEECKRCFKGSPTSHREGSLSHYIRGPTYDRLSSCVCSRVDAFRRARKETESATPIQKMDESLLLDLWNGDNITSIQKKSRETEEEALLARNHILENQVSLMQHELSELRYQVDSLKQQLKQAEVAKVDTLGELGRLLFCEDKKKRNLVSRDCGSCPVVSTKSDERLLDRSTHRWQGNLGFGYLQQRLLEIAHSLSGQDLTSMKMMLKGRVSGLRLARIKDVFQLFEDLLYREESPVDVIKELLTGIGRNDLLEKLGVLSCGVRKEVPEQYRKSDEIQGTPFGINQHLSELARIDRGLTLTSEILVKERGEDLIEPYLEEGNLRSYGEVESTQLRSRRPEDTRDISVCSGDFLSCGYTVDEKSSPHAHVRSCESQLVTASDGGLIEGRLLDFKRFYSACVLSENSSCDAGANCSEMQHSSNEHAPLCKCSKLPGEVTTDKITGGKIPMTSLLSEGNISRANGVLTGKELLIELDGGKQVQDNDFALCSEFQDPREMENALEQATAGGVQSARGGEFNEKDRVSIVPEAVPFPIPHDNGMPVTLPGTHTQRGTTGDATVDGKTKHGASGREGTRRFDELPYRMEDMLQSHFEASYTPNDSTAAAAAAPSHTSWGLSLSTDGNTDSLPNVGNVCEVSSKTTRDNVGGRNGVCDTHARPTHFDSENSSLVISTGEVFSDSVSPCLRPKDSSILRWRRYLTNIEMASFRDGGPYNDIESIPTTNNTLTESEGSCSGGAVISTTESGSRLRVGSRPKKRSDAKEQQVQGRHFFDDHSHETKSSTAPFGVVSAFLTRHSQDECLHQSPQNGVSEDWMHEDSSLEGAGYTKDAELHMMAISDSSWPVASVSEIPIGMDISSLYKLRGHFSAEHSTFNSGQFSRPLLNYCRGTDYSTINNYWNTSNDFPAYSYGNDSTQGGISVVDGCGMNHYAPVNVFSGSPLSEPVLEAEQNQIAINSSFFDSVMRQDTTIQPLHCIVSGDGSSSDTAFREVSSEHFRMLPSNPTYLESESTGVSLRHSPDWPCRYSNTRRTELVASDRSSVQARPSFSPLHFHANQSVPSVIAPSRTEIGTMTDHCVDSLLNRDSNAISGNSPPPAETSLHALEQRVAEACALVERVLREREERDLAERQLERREEERREKEAAKRREEEHQSIPGGSQWLCEHYQRLCRVRFPCCQQFYPCHRCHNKSSACPNDERKASHATHMKCSKCEHEQEINDGSKMCCSCGQEMSAYFCPICKHFTGVDKNPYHCKKCGICRIHQDRSFHCEVCNVCLDKRLQGKHKCRPDSGHDECCICLEDAFGGCQILPCSHKVHRECAIAMIENGIRNCPLCRHPLYTPASSS